MWAYNIIWPKISFDKVAVNANFLNGETKRTFNNLNRIHLILFLDLILCISFMTDLISKNKKESENFLFSSVCWWVS